MSIGILALICCVIAFFALGLHRKRKPDIEGVARAMEDQRKRQKEQRQAAIRRKYWRDLEEWRLVYESSLVDIEYRLDKAVSAAVEQKNGLPQDRAQLEHMTKLIESVISDNERGNTTANCRDDVLDALKELHEKHERRFVAAQVAVRTDYVTALSILDSLRGEVASITDWMKERAEPVQEGASQIIAAAESAICSQEARLEHFLEGVDTQPIGIEDDKVTPGVTKWREERLAARQQMALIATSKPSCG